MKRGETDMSNLTRMPGPGPFSSAQYASRAPPMFLRSFTRHAATIHGSQPELHHQGAEHGVLDLCRLQNETIGCMLEVQLQLTGKARACAAGT